MTREEKLRAEDMGQYFRIVPDSRDLNYDKFFVDGQVSTEANESYTSQNTTLLNVEETIAKLMTTDYVKDALKSIQTDAGPGRNGACLKMYNGKNDFSELIMVIKKRIKHMK